MAISFDGKLWKYRIRTFDLEKDYKKVEDIVNSDKDRYLNKHIYFTNRGKCLCVVEYMEYIGEDPAFKKEYSKDEEKQIKEFSKLENKAALEDLLSKETIIFGR